MDKLSDIFCHFWKQVNCEDLTETTSLQILGQQENVPKWEMWLCAYKHKGFEVNVAKIHDEIIGFILYHIIASCVIYVPCLYVKPEYLGRKIGGALARSTGPDVKRAIFSTRKSKPPEHFLKALSNKELIHENDKLSTWMMRIE